MLIYLDNAATTKPKYGDAIKNYIENDWFNPSSAYSEAARVFSQMKNTRQNLLDTTGFCGSVIFTSGGTEANNIAIQSAYKKDAHYITSTVEHPSVYAVFKQLEQNGATVDYVSPKGFCIYADDVARLVKEETALVSIMHVNNETGALNDIKSIASAVKAKNPKCLFHSDGVQALKKVDVSLIGSEVDFYSVSAHKINALKGTGALLVREGRHIRPLMFGGNQENKSRPGTENTLGIQVFGEALEFYKSDIEKVEKLRSILIEGLRGIEGAIVNIPDAYVPHIVSVSFEGVMAEVLVRQLGEKGICIGTGAACSKGKVSRVAIESGIERKLAEGTVRISMSSDNTEKEIDICLQELKESVTQLRRFNRN